MTTDSAAPPEQAPADHTAPKAKAKRRKLKFENLADAAVEARRLSQTDYSRAGTWSLAQVLQHLNKTLKLAIDGHPFLLPAFARPVVKWIALPLMRRGIQLPGGAKAPPALIPTDDANLQSELDDFERLAQLISNPDTKLHALHPLLGRIDHDQWNVMQRWHAAHHLSFIVPD